MICKFNHDGDCCNSGAKQYMCKCKQPCAEIIPMTNADRIRAMTDEELAIEMFVGMECGACPCAGKCGNGSHCKDTILEWLKQPAEES